MQEREEMIGDLKSDIIRWSFYQSWSFSSAVQAQNTLTYFSNVDAESLSCCNLQD